MILYVTKKTKERFNISMISELNEDNRNYVTRVYNNEKNNRLFEWGLKIFYMDRKKCIQAINFASKLTIYLFDIHNDSIEYIGDMIASYISLIYDMDQEMDDLIEKYLRESSVSIFSNLTDKTAISSLNYNEMCYVNTYRFYDYIENNVLKTIEINKDVNFNNLLTANINGKKEYVVPAKYFKELLINYYRNGDDYHE